MTTTADDNSRDNDTKSVRLIAVTFSISHRNGVATMVGFCRSILGRVRLRRWAVKALRRFAESRRRCSAAEEATGTKKQSCQNSLTRRLWRLLSFPDSLVARVIKGRYYPNSNLFEAKKRNSDSWMWRSWLNARDSLKRGVRFKIGDGKSIDIWKDPWVPNLSQFTPSCHSSRDREELKTVSDPFLTGKNKWDKKLVRQTFNPYEAEEILSIRLSLFANKDKLVWHFGVNGEFSVKSTYETIVAKMERDTSKVGPSCSNGQKKGMSMDTIFSICGEAEEDIDHLFVQCSRVQICWKLIGVHWDAMIGEQASIKAWWSEVSSGSKSKALTDRLVLSVHLLWKVWKARNNKCFRGDQFNELKVVVEAIRDWLEIRQDKVEEGCELVNSIHPTGRQDEQFFLGVGYVCLHISALSSFLGTVGIGGVAGSGNEVIKKWQCSWDGVTSESDGLLLGVRWILDLACKEGWKKVVCYINSPKLVKDLQAGSNQAVLGYDPVVFEVVCKLLLFDDCIFSIPSLSCSDSLALALSAMEGEHSNAFPISV
ncbi:RNA-directed DNA polymerase (reversetranscriptase)-related family protein [Striga asiatica]|uniref:RNA-directed DNA polymerase (Reversetranscriptase)-related family protein n=1 Tax=Striga asiatica TaxID=4170 RepID=A0A5A7PP86_STRAF|nr:RNA-directed DNA polymerase (reversetranscriptase)-related family protein [Striga asiatica]